MASPIFFSKPSAAYSLAIVLRGIQITGLALYRLSYVVLTTVHLSQLVYFIVWAIQLSVVLVVIVNGPIYIVEKIVYALSGLLGFGIETLDLRAVPLYLNTNILVMASYGFWRDDLDSLFLAGARYSDKLNGTRYYKSLVSLPKNRVDHRTCPSVFDRLISGFSFSPRYRQFLVRYVQFYLTSAVAFTASIHPSKLSTPILGLICFQTITSKLGSFAIIALVVALTIIPHYYIARCVTAVCASILLSHDMLLPFFNRVNFSPYEKEQWLHSRGGALLGFGLVIFYLINEFTYLSVVTYALGQMAMGHCITQLLEQVPDNIKGLLTWTPTQVVWSNQYAFANGDFLNDPFASGRPSPEHEN